MLGVYKIISKQVSMANGKTFYAHALIHPETKKKIDFRFKLNATNTELIQKDGKFRVVIDTEKMSYTELYEYPRIYCDGIERLATDEDALSESLK